MTSHTQVLNVVQCCVEFDTDDSIHEQAALPGRAMSPALVDSDKVSDTNFHCTCV